MERKMSVPAFGGSSLLAIFAVLCLTVFALLSFSTVHAEKRLSDSALSSVTAYYEADTQAEKIFALLRNGQLPEGVTKEGNLYTYICPISHSQQLVVELEQGETWQVRKWHAQAITNTETDDHLPVWDGE